MSEWLKWSQIRLLTTLGISYLLFAEMVSLFLSDGATCIVNPAKYGPLDSLAGLSPIPGWDGDRSPSGRRTARFANRGTDLPANLIARIGDSRCLIWAGSGWLVRLPHPEKTPETLVLQRLHGLMEAKPGVYSKKLLKHQ
jgi:hypothetical protein